MDYRKYLTDDVLKFWLEHGIDPVHGGIMTQMDACGTVTCENKSVMFAGRSLWTFAMAYQILDQKSEYLNACEQIYRHIVNCEQPDGTLPDLTDREGNMLNHQNGYTHSEMHAATGIAQYYRITEDPAHRQKAEQYFDIADRWYRQWGPRRGGATQNAKSFGLNMLVLWTAQFVRNAGIRVDACNALAKLAIEEMICGGYVDDEKCQVIEIVSQDGSPVSAMSCPGHIYEAAWFVMCEGQIQNDDAIQAFGRKLCDYAMPEEFMTYDPFVPTSRDVQKYPLGDPQENYVWWPQCEAIVTYRLAYHLFADEKYREMADLMEETAFAAFADRKNGEWYTAVSHSKEVSDDNKGSLIKGPFHLPRMLLVLMCLKENGNIESYMK